MDEKPLFTVDYGKTLTDYRQFLRYADRITKPIFLVSFIIIQLTRFIYFGYHNFIFFALNFLYTSVIFFLFVFIPTILFRYIYSSYSWKSEKAPKLSHFSFFADKMVEFDGLNTTSCAYKDLNKIIETNDYFFIMMSLNRGHIIKKDVCSAELQDFIRNIKKTE